MKRNILAFTLCVLVAASAGAQVRSSEAMDAMRREFEAFREKAHGDYEDFRKKANDEYADFLKKAWKEYQTIGAVPKPKEEPPVPPKPYEDDKRPIKDNPKPIDEVIKPSPPAPRPEPVKPIEPAPAPVTDRWFTFRSFGTPMRVRLDDSHRFRLGAVSEGAVASAWQRLSGNGYDKLVADCLALRRDLQLSDWGYLLMLRDMSRAFLGNTNEATMLAAYVYCQSGYKMKFAHASGRLYMLFASRHVLYDCGRFVVGGDYFYPFECKEKSLCITSAAFPGEQPLSLEIPFSPRLSPAATSPRTLKSRRYNDMELTTTVNKNVIDFYDTYPTSEIGGNFMTRWAMYANTPLGESTRKALYPALKAKIAGCTQPQSVDKLLNWVQTAFVYEYDTKVWGGDRAFFADETLYYPYCDCEDRSILFSRLVRDLLGLDVVLVYYPGHLATAVNLTEGEIKGDYLTLGGRRYVVCDPTYINAPAGHTMTGMDNAAAKVILLNR